MAMSPRRRRILQAVLYEVIALAVVAPALALLLHRSAATSFWLAVLMSTVALVWGIAFNTVFERWEARQPTKGRSPLRRIAHGAGFEGGLVVLLVPIMAWGLDISWRQAFVADLGVLAFFLVYSIVFTWAFDRVFGLPASAA